MSVPKVHIGLKGESKCAHALHTRRTGTRMDMRKAVRSSCKLPIKN